MGRGLCVGLALLVLDVESISPVLGAAEGEAELGELLGGRPERRREKARECERRICEKVGEDVWRREKAREDG